ncbi:unnamed protein product [Pedinophyceae sp. YPF-701]|nr:unnamed protein product [Pedinophyceae sp. YPF-701]
MMGAPAVVRASRRLLGTVAALAFLALCLCTAARREPHSRAPGGLLDLPGPPPEAGPALRGGAAPAGRAGRHLRQRKEAYVALIYTDNFLLGTRVLGQSIRDTGTNRDLVVLATEAVSDTVASILEGDGWIVKRIATIANPGTGPSAVGKNNFPAKFWGVYSKLTVWNLVEYDKVIYLDSDILVTQNIDELFACPGLCVVVRHSERFNSGVMVLDPSAEVFDDMLAKISQLQSYTGGDQGFLNEYYSEFVEAPIFQPSGPKLDPSLRTARLTTGYNGDIGLYILNSGRWMIPESQIKVLHFTLGPLKPWDWWSGFIMEQVKDWNACRARLAPIPLSASLATGVGLGDAFARLVLVPLPWLVALWAIIVNNKKPGFKLALMQLGQSAVNMPSSLRKSVVFFSDWTSRSPSLIPEYPGGWRLPPRFHLTSGVVGITSLLAAALAALWIIPSTIEPFYGYLLTYQWVTFIFLAFFSQYLRLCMTLGARSRSSSDRGSPLSSGRAAGGLPWTDTLSCYIAIVATGSLIPLGPYLLGVRQLFPKLGMVVFGIMVELCVLNYAMLQLPGKWFFAGRMSA